MLAHAYQLKRVDLYLRFDQRADQQEPLARFREAVKRRRDREPVAYVIGAKPFHDLELLVPPGVFVPRPETELVVDEAVARLRLLNPNEATLLDLCAGSGAIGLALAHACPGLKVTSVDLDPALAQVIGDNAARVGVNERVEFLRGDLFGPVPPDRTFNLVTCNPPYVPTAEIETLQPEVRDHEPRRALDGGEDGLDLVRRLLDEAPRRMKPGGWLFVEIGEGQAPMVAAMAAEDLIHETTRTDLGGCERIVIFNKQSLK